LILENTYSIKRGFDAAGDKIFPGYLIKGGEHENISVSNIHDNERQGRGKVVDRF
jgi:hypothetical protein